VSGIEKPEGGSFVEVREDFSRGEIESELRLVLNDPEFLKNSNCAKFLKFIVDETLDGRGARLKAYTIATLALEREASFDPQANSIVRVQAMRLRGLLESYYAGAGASDPVQITVRRGTYQPAFERRVEAEEAGTEVAAAMSPAPEKPRWLFPYATASLIIGCLAAAGFIGWAIWTAPGHPSTSSWPPASAMLPDGPPSVVVEAPETTDAPARTARLSDRLFGSIEEGLGNFDYIALRAWSSRFRNRRDVENGYVLNSRLEDSTNGRFDVAMRLVYAPTGDVIWSHHYDDVNSDDRDALDKLAISVVADVADPYGGAILADIRDRLQSAKAPARGYACLVVALEFLRTRATEQRAIARKCLESEIAANPKNVGAITLLAKVLIFSYLDMNSESEGIGDLQRASQLAGLAKDLAPQRATTLDALFLGRFYNKHFDTAFFTARQVLAANPSGILFSERIASAYISRGLYAEGLALLRPMEATVLGPPIGSKPFLALAAYMRGDVDATWDYAQRPSEAATPMGLVMRIVACHQHGDVNCVRAASERLLSDYPRFARDIPAALDRYGMIDSIKTNLLKDLAAAGYTQVAAHQ
jgi:adenylate cyclase